MHVLLIVHTTKAQFKQGCSGTALGWKLPDVYSVKQHMLGIIYMAIQRESNAVSHASILIVGHKLSIGH